MVKDHSDSERGNPLLPHGLLFPISSKGHVTSLKVTGHGQHCNLEAVMSLWEGRKYFI